MKRNAEQHEERRLPVRAAAYDLERQQAARRERIEFNKARVQKLIMGSLALELRNAGGDGNLLEGWTAKFDLCGVTGDPEGEQRRPLVNVRHKSIVFVAPWGKKFTSRDAVFSHLGVERKSNGSNSSSKGRSGGARGTNRAEDAENLPPAPVTEPPPVKTDEGLLAFEVERILDVRCMEAKGRRRKVAKAPREFLVRWVGYGADEDSWEPEESFLDRGPIDDFFEGQPSMTPREGSVWRRFQKIGPEHQVDVPVWKGPTKATKGSASKDKARRVDIDAELSAHDRATGALLTASAFGPISERAYVAPTDCDLGLFARRDLHPREPDVTRGLRVRLGL